jgi:Ca2+-binding RTX toxin-like protein
VGVNGSALVFTAAPGESNNVEIEGGGGLPFSVQDLGAVLTPGAGCTTQGAHRATCPSVGVASISIDTRDGTDIVIVNTVVPSTLRGGCGNDVVEGGSANDTIVGDPNGCAQPGNDSLDGRDGNDTLLGGPGVDTLKGGMGADGLLGGPGQDDLQGQSGGDRIGSNDGEADTVSCGSGVDGVRADPTDTIAPDCERVVA